jgi:uncharacterized protein YjbJ (UPF0337 family)
MNRRQAQGQLLRVAGALQESWGWVINDQTMRIRGERQRLWGRLLARDGALRVILFSRQPVRKPVAHR